MKCLNSTVTSIQELWPGAWLLRSHAPEIAALARPGQYVMIRCGEGCDMSLRRPLSVHRISDDGNVAFLFSVVGRGTEWLAQRYAGDKLDIFGPLGRGFDIFSSSRNLLIIAGGIGIAPMVALADSAVVAGKNVTLLIGCGTASQIYPGSMLPPGVETIVTTEDGSLGRTGVVTDLLLEYVADADQVFACGPLQMYRKMVEMCSILGEKPVQVLLEQRLGCGVGACLGCTIETVTGNKRVCKDGPVFEFKEILWDRIVAPATSEALQKRREYKDILYP